MLRRAFLFACFLVLAFMVGVPAQALAHGGHAESANVAIAAADDSVFAGAAEGETSAVTSAVLQSLQSYSQPGNQPLADNDCHCPVCHGCCHAPALNDGPAQFAPIALRSHAAPRDDGWFVRRSRSAIENPPKTFA